MLFALLGFIVSVLIAGVAGAVVHEFAHFLVWELAGRRPVIDWWALDVRATAGDENLLAPWRVQWYDRVAAGAPMLLGILTAPALVLWPSVDVLVFWAVLTLGGAGEDWKTVFRPYAT